MRLIEAGANHRISSSQFGFRPKRGTEDALHCARRAVDVAWAHRDGKVHLLALDWRKAFDSINAEGLIDALRRFGIPQFFLEIVKSIYSDRAFRVKDGDTTSDRRRQHSGICQGCPLSPFLFIMVMTILMHDAYGMLGAHSSRAVERSSLYDILYADDTLVVGADAKCVEELAVAIEKSGARYGMSLHWGKVQAMPVRTDAKLHQANGDEMQRCDSIIYLGT